MSWIFLNIFKAGFLLCNDRKFGGRDFNVCSSDLGSPKIAENGIGCWLPTVSLLHLHPTPWNALLPARGDGTFKSYETYE